MQFCARRWAVITGAIFSLFVATGPTQASVVLLDTLSGTSYVPGTGYSIFDLGFSSQSVAVSFNASNAWTITSIDTYISSQFGGVMINLGIMADNGGRPSGTFLSSTTVGLTADPLSLSSLNWSIDAGSKYWLAAIALGDDASWQAGTVQGTLGFTSGGGWTTESNFLPAAIISAELTSETPLPGAIVLFASGIGGFGLFSLRGKQKKLSGIAA